MVTPACVIYTRVCIHGSLLELGGPVWDICRIQKAKELSQVLGNPTGQPFLLLLWSYSNVDLPKIPAN